VNAKMERRNGGKGEYKGKKAEGDENSSNPHN
jgi:hypothetical protein